MLDCWIWWFWLYWCGDLKLSLKEKCLSICLSLSRHLNNVKLKVAVTVESSGFKEAS